MKKILNKVCLSIIFLLCSLIFVEYGNNRELYKNNVLENNISFSKLRSYYDKYFVGKKNEISDEEVMVSNEIDEIIVDGRYKYLKEEVKSIESGIVVYVGEKDNLGNTVIVQGVDGVDVWYSNLGDVRVSLYDYVSSGDLLGLSNEYYLISLYKDGKLITYEEYN